MTRGQWLVWAGLVGCLLLAGGVVGGSSTVAAQSDSVTATVSNESAWPSFGLRPDGNRALPNGTGPVETGVVQWNYTTGGSVHSSPAVVDETLYVGSDDDRVYAFDTRTGIEQWNYSTDGNVLSSPAVTNGTVYVGSYDDKVYALNAIDGTERWNYSTGGIVWSSPAVVDGTVYVGSDDKTVYVINAQTGSEQWNYTTEGKVQSSPAVANGTVYVGSYDHDVYALNATDGTEVWNYSRGSGGNEISSPAVVNDTVYIGGVGGAVYALNATDGTERWGNTDVADVQSSPTVWNNTVYIGGGEGDDTVYALNATTGTERWNYTTGAKVYSTPTVVNGTVYVGSYDNNVSAIDAVKGTELWRYTTGGSVFSSPTVVDGTVYVGSLDGDLYALHADDSVPILSAYTVSNPSDRDVTVRFDSDKILTNISVSIHDTESATLSTSDFTPTVDTDDDLTYTAVYTGSSDGTYTATLDTAEDGAGNDAATGQQESVSVDTTPTTNPGSNRGSGSSSGSSRSTDSESTVTVVPDEASDASESDSSTSGSGAAESTDSRSVTVRDVSRGERVSVGFTTADGDGTATDQDASTADGDEPTSDSGGSDEPTPQRVRNVVPDGLDIRFAEAGEYEFTVRTRDAETSDSSDSEPDGTGDAGSTSRPDLSTNTLDTEGVRFARETRQRPVGFIEVDTEFEETAVETATHRFRVRKSYLESTGASVDSVRLYRDEISQWRELDTQQVRETEEYHFFEAETPGFSLFVIGTSAPVFETTDQQLVDFDESTGEVEATVSVENIGSESGIYDAVLSANGEPIGTADVPVAADERVDVTVTGTVETTDSVTLGLAGQSLGDVTRTESTPEPIEPERSGLRLVGVLVGVAVVVIGGLLWSRRNNSDDIR